MDISTSHESHVNVLKSAVTLLTAIGLVLLNSPALAADFTGQSVGVSDGTPS